MKKFNKFLAMLLCAVMIVGAVPFVMGGSNDVVAAEDGGVVQGPNDAVIIMDETSVAALETAGYPEKNFIKSFTGNKVKSTGNSSDEAFDRIIVLFTVDFNAVNDLALGASTITGSEKVVFTNKATINYTQYVWKCTKKDAFSQTTEYSGLQNHYDNAVAEKNAEFSFPDKALGFMRFEVNLELDYLNLSFPNTNPIFYCGMRNFTVGENVNFILAGTAVANYPIVVNFKDGYFWYKGDSTYTIPESMTQTITLLSGSYQYVSPRSRSYSNTYTDCVINLVLGKARFVGGPNTQMARGAFIANDNFVRTTVNVEIDGAIFDNTVWFLGATEFAASANPRVEDAVINLHVKKGTFRGGIGDTIIPSDSQYKQYDTTGGLEINVVVDSIILGTNTNITAENESDADKITSALYRDPAFEGEYSNDFNAFDKVYLLDDSLTTRVECGVGVSELVYVNEVDPTDKKTIERDCAEHNYAAYLDREMWQAHYRCTYCGSDNTDFVTNGYNEPVIYVTGTKGNVLNSGINEENGVDTIERAAELLSEWGMGGTVVNCASLLKPGEETWKNTVGTLKLTSKNENSKVQFQGFVNFEGDVCFSGLYLAATNTSKTFFLNYNNFWVDDTCHQDASYKLAVVTGARAASPQSVEKYATNREEIVQVVDLQSLSWNAVYAGTKQANSPKDMYASNADKSINCTGYINITIGGDANVSNVDIVTNDGMFAKVILSNDKDINIKNNHDSSAIGFVFADCEDDVTNVYGNFTATENDVTGSEEHVYRYDPDFFTNLGMSLKAGDEDGFYGFRASFGISSGCDESAVEFGTIVFSAWNDIKTRYFRGNTYYGGTATDDALYTADGIAKSVAYLQNAQGKADIANYELAVGDDEAVFRATVEFNDATIIHFDGCHIHFTPYAVVKDAAGWFTVIGDNQSESLYGLASLICDDETAPEADKAKALKVMDYIENLMDWE